MANTPRFKISDRPKTITLPSIKKQLQIPNENKSPLFKSLSQENLVSPNSHDIVKTWLSIQPEPNKRVKFAREERKTRRFTFNTVDSLPDIDQHVPNLDLTPFQPETHDEDESTKHPNLPTVTIREASFYRSQTNKTLSVSSATSSSLITRQRQSSFLRSTPPIHQHPPSIDNAPSTISTSTIKDRSSNFSLLEFNSTLSENDRRKFDDIRQQVPDEFDLLLPTLLKLGVVLWPKKFFDPNHYLTNKESKQRQRLITIIEKDHNNSQHQRHLHRLYGSVFPHDISNKHHLLRENLSFQGQLSLLSAYREEIENELTKKIQHWRAVPMKTIRTSSIDEYNQRTSSISKTKHHQSYSNIYQFTNDELFSLTLPDKIDSQWQRKSLVKIIEQGMNLLDQARKLPTEDTDDCQRQDLVRTFKRWLYLWSTLYTEDKCFR